MNEILQYMFNKSIGFSLDAPRLALPCLRLQCCSVHTHRAHCNFPWSRASSAPRRRKMHCQPAIIHFCILNNFSIKFWSGRVWMSKYCMWACLPQRLSIGRIETLVHAGNMRAHTEITTFQMCIFIYYMRALVNDNILCCHSGLQPLS